VQNPLLRNSLKLFVATFITATIAGWTERIQFVWYPLLAVVVVVDDNDDQTLKAAAGRILGTITGGLITFLVHTILGGWIGVLVSLLVMIPVLQMFGWQSTFGTAGLVSLMFLMIPSHAELNWDYVFNRALDTVVGCVVALLVGLLFWPRNAYQEMALAQGRLRSSLQRQLERYASWLNSGAPRPMPLDPKPLTSDLVRMEDLVTQERNGPKSTALRTSRWEQRLRLWQLTHFHWLAWERLLHDLPEAPLLHDPLLLQSVTALLQQLQGQPSATPPRQPERWQQLAQQRQLPLLPLLALEEEQRPLHACLGGLRKLAAQLPEPTR